MSWYNILGRKKNMDLTVELQKAETELQRLVGELQKVDGIRTDLIQQLLKAQGALEALKKLAQPEGQPK